MIILLHLQINTKKVSLSKNNMHIITKRYNPQVPSKALILPYNIMLPLNPALITSQNTAVILYRVKNTALVLLKEKNAALIPYVPSIPKTIAITHIPPNTIMPTGQIVTDQRAAFELIAPYGNIQKNAQQHFLKEASSAIEEKFQSPLHKIVGTAITVLKESYSQSAKYGTEHVDSEIQEGPKTVLINKNSSKQDIAQEKEQLYQKNRKESDEILLNNYKKIMLTFTSIEKELEQADSFENGLKILTELLGKVCMQEAFHLATKLSTGIIMTNEHKDVCKAFLSLQKSLDDLYKKHIIEKNITSNNVKFIQKKIDTMVNPELKSLCQSLFTKKCWINFKELKEESALYLSIINTLKNEDICTKDLLALGIRFEEKQPILFKTLYKMMSLAPENYNINFIDKELNISNIIQQFVDQDFWVGKLEKNTEAIIDLADTIHHMIFTPLYLNGMVEKYVSFVYFTSTANNFKVSNNQIFPEEGSKKAQYISIWNVGRIISKEQVAKTQKSPDGMNIF